MYIIFWIFGFLKYVGMHDDDGLCVSEYIDHGSDG